MLIEFVTPLPFTLEEYNRGQLHLTAQMSENTTSATGEYHHSQYIICDFNLAVARPPPLPAEGGVEIVVNEPFDNTDGHWGVSPITGITVPRTRGQYTLKRYHIKSKFPSIVVAMLPENAMFLIEESWSELLQGGDATGSLRRGAATASQRRTSLLRLPWQMRTPTSAPSSSTRTSRSTVFASCVLSPPPFNASAARPALCAQDIESTHIADDVGGLENPLGFTPAELAARRRELIDIAVAGQQRDDKEFKGLYKPECVVCYVHACACGLRAATAAAGPAVQGRPDGHEERQVRPRALRPGVVQGFRWAAHLRLQGCPDQCVPARPPPPPAAAATRAPAPAAAFAYFPAQGTVEGMIATSQLRLFGRSLSTVVGRTDQWFDLSLADVREYEAVRGERGGAGRGAAAWGAKPPISSLSRLRRCAARPSSTRTSRARRRPRPSPGQGTPARGRRRAAAAAPHPRLRLRAQRLLQQQWGTAATRLQRRRQKKARRKATVRVKR